MIYKILYTLGHFGSIFWVSHSVINFFTILIHCTFYTKCTGIDGNIAFVVYLTFITYNVFWF